MFLALFYTCENDVGSLSFALTMRGILAAERVPALKRKARSGPSRSEPLRGTATLAPDGQLRVWWLIPTGFRASVCLPRASLLIRLDSPCELESCHQRELGRPRYQILAAVDSRPVGQCGPRPEASGLPPGSHATPGVLLAELGGMPLAFLASHPRENCWADRPKRRRWSSMPTSAAGSCPT